MFWNTWTLIVCEDGFLIISSATWLKPPLLWIIIFEASLLKFGKERLTSGHCGRSVCNSDCHFWQPGYGRALVQPWKVFEREEKRRHKEKGTDP